MHNSHIEHRAAIDGLQQGRAASTVSAGQASLGYLTLKTKEALNCFLNIPLQWEMLK